MSAYEKELFSNTDVTSNLEIPQSALYLPDAVEDNEIMLAWDHGKIWRFKAPLRRDGTGRRYMSCQWRQFAKDNSLMDRDVVKFYRSTSIVNLYVVSFERTLRGCSPLIYSEQEDWRLLVLISGSGNSIFLSIRPGRSRAGSRLSILFVARITLTSHLESKPSKVLPVPGSL
ncbi:uncharacterized protein LOC114300140 [Camellia sinensis]|uniref:uncharacterized protein LOC114300140 n=1 Tax=Camellia sinensis TaxID=4442 RepID=UPI001035EBEB|nr:uncharacterized protein LOC114300140 [Camellia sinensis]